MKSKKFGVSVTKDIQDEIQLVCQFVEIEQVLVNLINNSADAVSTLPDKWIKIVVFQENESAVVQVIDSGTGISAELAPKLFQPFFTTKPPGSGTGLGLSICKGIIEDHKGSVEVKTLSGHTCFEIRIPIQSAESLNKAG